MPYVTETLCKEYFGLKKLQISMNWPQIVPLGNSETACKEAEFLIALLTEVRTIKSELRVPLKQELDLLINNVDEEKVKIIKKYKNIIIDLGKLTNCEIIKKEFPKGSALGVIQNISIALPLMGKINIKDEINRLNKEIIKIDNDIVKIESNLKNKNFLNRAPKDVVEEIKVRLEIDLDKKNKLKESINRLNF